MTFDYPKVDATLTLTHGPVGIPEGFTGVVPRRWAERAGWIPVVFRPMHRKPGRWDVWEETPRAVADRRAVWPFT